MQIPRVFIGVVAVAALAVTAVLFVEGKSEPDNPGTAPADDQHVVEIVMGRGSEYTFVNDPVGIWVEPGTTVRFVNAQASHTATAYHPDNGKDLRIPAGAESWDSRLLTEGEIYEVVLTVEGVYDYYCAPHEHMGHIGRIIVGDPDQSPAVPSDDLPGLAAEAMPSVASIMDHGYVAAR